jgi:hypothetical protein
MYIPPISKSFAKFNAPSDLIDIRIFASIYSKEALANDHSLKCRRVLFQFTKIAHFIKITNNDCLPLKFAMLFLLLYNCFELNETAYNLNLVLN